MLCTVSAFRNACPWQNQHLSQYDEHPVRAINREVYRLFEESKLFPEPPARSLPWIRPVLYVSFICSENFEFLEIKRQIAKLQSNKYLIGEWGDMDMFCMIISKTLDAPWIKNTWIETRIGIKIT